MQVNIISEHGYLEALLGMGLSFGLTSGVEAKDFLPVLTNKHAIEKGIFSKTAIQNGCHDEDIKLINIYEKLHKRAEILAHKQGGHNKFLESMIVYLDIDAPRYFWQQFDTYRVGMTKQSESTMHRKEGTLYKFEDFEHGINIELLNTINSIVPYTPKHELRDWIPESLLQRRIVCTNYKVIQNIVSQRHDHKLKQWHTFCDAMRNLEHSKFIFKE